MADGFSRNFANKRPIMSLNRPTNASKDEKRLDSPEPSQMVGGLMALSTFSVGGVKRGSRILKKLSK